jgi:hypothetical protein
MHESGRISQLLARDAQVALVMARPGCGLLYTHFNRKFRLEAKRASVLAGVVSM